MKRKTLATPVISGLLLAAVLLLAACGPTAAPQPTPDLSAESIATIVAQTLAAQNALSSPTPSPVDGLPVQPPAVENPTAVPTVEPTPTLELVVMPTATPEPTPTPTPAPTAVPLPSPTASDDDPVVSLGGSNFTDRMDNTTYWPTDEDSFTRVEFEDSNMIYTALTGTDGWRLLSWPPVTDFYVEIRGEFEDCAGTDHFGLIVRVPEKKTANQGYLFGVSCDGRFTFNEWDGSVEPNGSWTSHIFWKSHPVIASGEGNTNRIGIMAVGDRLTLYINGEKVAEVKDATFSEGSIGVYVGSDETDDLTVRINELNLWDLSQ